VEKAVKAGAGPGAAAAAVAKRIRLLKDAARQQVGRRK
jgi:hypothetical protein